MPAPDPHPPYPPRPPRPPRPCPPHPPHPPHPPDPPHRPDGDAVPTPYESTPYDRDAAPTPYERAVVPPANPLSASAHRARWYDEEAGPLVRPYAMTGGRTRTAGPELDPIVLVGAEPAVDPHELPPSAPEPARILGLCRERVRSVAELAAGLDLPLGVVRVLLGDLLASGHIRVSRPVPPALLPDEYILREVVRGGGTR